MPIFSITKELNLVLFNKNGSRVLSEESRINSTEISLITVCDTHLYTNSNGDSCPQFLIMVAGHSEVGFS